MYRRRGGFGYCGHADDVLGAQKVTAKWEKSMSYSVMSFAWWQRWCGAIEVQKKWDCIFGRMEEEDFGRIRRMTIGWEGEVDLGLYNHRCYLKHNGGDYIWSIWSIHLTCRSDLLSMRLESQFWGNFAWMVVNRCEKIGFGYLQTSTK